MKNQQKSSTMNVPCLNIFEKNKITNFNSQTCIPLLLKFYNDLFLNHSNILIVLLNLVPYFTTMCLNNI